MRTRIFSLILAVMILFTSVDITVFAEEMKDTLGEQSVSENEIVVEGEDDQQVDWLGDDSKQVNSQREPQESDQEGLQEFEQKASEDLREGNGVNFEETTLDLSTNSSDLISGKCGENLTWTIENGVLKISGTGSMYHYSLKTSSSGTIVPSSPWYAYQSDFNALVIEEGVTGIGAYAFYGCSNMSGELELPDSVTFIWDYAFYNCSGLTGSLVIPEGIIEIRMSSFERCAGFDGVLYLPNSILGIGDFAFNECTGFTGELRLPTDLEIVGDYAFYGCTGFTGDLIFPDKVESIGTAAFRGCSGFNGKLSISNSVIEIGDRAFYGCSGFAGTLKISSGLKIIDEYVFYRCSGLSGELIIPEGITSIGYASFGMCSGFTGNLVIPESVTTIGDGAFHACNGLNGRLYITDNVISMGEYSISTITEIYGISGSYAESYAAQHGIEFIAYDLIGTENMSIDELLRSVHVYVVDAETGDPIEHAYVNGVHANNIKGYIALSSDEIDEKYTIMADGYISSVKFIDLEPGETCFFTLYKENGTFDVVKADVESGERSMDVLAHKLYLEHISVDMDNEEQLILSIVARGHAVRYELIRNGESAGVNDTGIFRIPVYMYPDGSIRTSWDACDEMSVRIINEEGKTIEKKLGICISEESGEATETDDSGKLTIGKEISLEIPKEVPLLGGGTVAYGFKEKLPFEVEIETDGKVKIALNKKSGISMSVFKKEYDKLDSHAKRASALADAFGGSPAPFGGGYFKFDCYCYGYGEGYIDKDKPGVYKLEIGIIIGAKDSAGYKQYLYVGYIPVYLKVEAEAGLEGEVGIYAEYNSNNNTLSVDGGLGKLKGTISLKPTAGIGVDNAFTVKVSGSGEAGYLWEPLDDYQKVWLEANASATLQLGPFFKKPIWKTKIYEKVLYETERKEADKDDGSASGSGISSINSLSLNESEFQEVYDTSTYQIMDRSYLDNYTESYAPSINTEGNADSPSVTYSVNVGTDANGMIQTSIYPGAEPRIITVGDKLYLFWLQDIESRSAENRAAIVYSVSGDGVIWSSPKQLIAEEINKTLDNDFDLFVEGEKIYICWQDASETLETGVSLGEALQKFHIAYAIIDTMTNEVIAEDLVTKEAGCNLQPHIAAQNGNVWISWIQNNIVNEDVIWADDNTQMLMLYNGKSKEVSAITFRDNTQKVIGLDVAVSKDEAGLVYVLDNDGSYMTVNDRDVYYDTRNIRNNGSLQCLTSERADASNVTVENDVIYWYADNNIYYKDLESADTKSIYEEMGSMVPSSFKVAANGSQTQILWESIDEKTDMVSVSAIRYLGDDKWSMPFVLEETDSEETGTLSGTYLENQLFMAFLHTATQKDGSQICSICVTEEQAEPDVELLFAEYDNEELIPGKSLPVTAYVTNNGNVAIDTVSIYVDGKELAEKEIDLGVGESTSITFSDYVVPQDISQCEEYVLEITAENETNTDDNIYTMQIGMTDIAVLCNQRLHNESTWLDISVLNESYITTDCTLNIRANAKDGEIIYSEELGTVEGGKGVSLTVNLHEYESHYCTFYVEVETDEEEAVSGNNIEFVFTGYGTDIEGGSLSTAPTTYIVSFNSNGGSTTESQEVVDGTSALKPIDPVKENYIFVGWYLDGNLYDFNTAVTDDIELLAKWTECTRLPLPTSYPEAWDYVEVGGKIVLSCAAPGAQIYYTTDGGTPTEESILYEEPIVYQSGMSISAIAIQDGYKNSYVKTFTYNDAYRVTFDSAGGTEVESQIVKKYYNAIKPIDPVKKWYHFDGWYLNDKLYNFNTSVKESITLMAHWRDMDVLNAPTANIPDTEEIRRGTSISLISDMPGSKIYYTLDGSIPTEESSLYREPITITEDTVISAIAVKEGYKDSEVAQYHYVISRAGDVLLEDMPEEGVDALPDGLWVAGLDENGYTYTGSAIRPDIRVYDGTTLLVRNTDYTISYKNNVKVSADATTRTAPRITIKGKGNYEGTVTVYFAILPKSLSDTDITIQELTSKYNGRTQKKIPTVTWNGGKLRHMLDYVVEYPDLEEDVNAYKEPGTYDILIKGTGNHTGEKIVKFTITNNELISRAYVSKIAEQKYTGKAIEPGVSVKHNFKTLTKGTDYTVTYTDNTEVGTATAVITGRGDYSGTKTVTFEIVGIAITGAAVSNIPDSFVYAGSAITTEDDEWKKAPKLTMFVNGRNITLTEGEDYKVSYSSNTNKGVANIIFTGMGAYSGELRKTFRIQAYDISEDVAEKMTVYLEADSFEYEKNGIRPKPVVMFGNRILTEKKDYTLSYRYHYKINDGTDKENVPAVIIKGKGNFTGIVEENFVITTSDISDLEMTAEDKVFINNAGMFESEPVIMTESGQRLKKGEDYNETLTYCYKEKTTLEDGTVREAGELVEKEDIVPEDTIIEVIAIGKGSYEGLLKSEYRVVKYDISKASVDIPKMDYTGEAITFDKSDITIKFGDTILGVEDFEIVSYEDNIDRGKAKVTIKGLGEYGGIKTVKFTIKSKLLEWWEGVLARLFG